MTIEPPQRSAGLTIHQQSRRGESPWRIREQVRLLLWDFCWAIFCEWTPKPLNRWRLGWLRLFGAKISGHPFVHQRARVKVPWNLTLGDRSCLGDRTNIYSLGAIEVEEGATVAQEAYLCGGTHDFGDPALSLVTAEIVVKREAFIGARAFVMPGVVIGEKAIIGACAVVTKNVGAGEIVAGNPARCIGERERIGSA